jgi:SAM-dependent methyltransferase
MNLFDVLACPVCRAPVQPAGPVVSCTGCARTYPFTDGVPVMLADSTDADSDYEGDLGVRPGYSRWKERIVIKSLLDEHPVLDFGAGRQALDDPCIIRMDLKRSPYVDVVGDAMALPFADESIAFAFGGAVMEHVPDPARVVRELHRVVRPGGYVYADWSSVFAYHGYPHHYFNATINGIRKAFEAFTVLDVGVAPFHGPAFSLRSVLQTYAAHFKPRTLRDHWFAAQIDSIIWAPLDELEGRFDPADRFRVAAGVYVLAVKQPTGSETLIPAPVMDAWRREPALQARFPHPLDLSLPDNLMTWANGDGARSPAIRDALTSGERFCKWTDASRLFDRANVESWPLELLDAVDPQPPARWRLGRIGGREIGVDVPYGWFKSGWRGAIRRPVEVVWRWLRGRLRGN